MVFVVAVYHDDDKYTRPVAGALYEVCLLEDPAPFVEKYLYVSRSFGGPFFGGDPKKLYGMIPDKKRVFELIRDEKYMSMLFQTDVKKDGIYVDVRLIHDSDSARSVVYAVKASKTVGYLSLFAGGHSLSGMAGPSMGMALLVECCRPQTFFMAFTGAVNEFEWETLDTQIGGLKSKIALCQSVGCPLVIDSFDISEVKKLDILGVRIVLPDELVTERNLNSTQFNVYAVTTLVEAVFAAETVEKTTDYLTWVEQVPFIGQNRIGSRMTITFPENAVDSMIFSNPWYDSLEFRRLTHAQKYNKIRHQLIPPNAVYEVRTDKRRSNVQNDEDYENKLLKRMKASGAVGESVSGVFNNEDRRPLIDWSIVAPRRLPLLPDEPEEQGTQYDTGAGYGTVTAENALLRIFAYHDQMVYDGTRPQTVRASFFAAIVDWIEDFLPSQMFTPHQRLELIVGLEDSYLCDMNTPAILTRVRDLVDEILGGAAGANASGVIGTSWDPWDHHSTTVQPHVSRQPDSQQQAPIIDLDESEDEDNNPSVLNMACDPSWRHPANYRPNAAQIERQRELAEQAAQIERQREQAGQSGKIVDRPINPKSIQRRAQRQRKGEGVVKTIKPKSVQRNAQLKRKREGVVRGPIKPKSLQKRAQRERKSQGIVRPLAKPKSKQKAAQRRRQRELEKNPAYYQNVSTNPFLWTMGWL